jgi:hypothetical protein
MLGDAIFEFGARLVPFLQRRLLVVEKEAKGIGKQFGSRETGIENALAVLVKHRALRRLKENVSLRISESELGFDLFIEIVGTVLRLPKTVGKMELIDNGTVSPQRLLTAPQDRVTRARASNRIGGRNRRATPETPTELRFRASRQVGRTPRAIADRLPALSSAVEVLDGRSSVTPRIAQIKSCDQLTFRD